MPYLPSLEKDSGHVTAIHSFLTPRNTCSEYLDNLIVSERFLLSLQLEDLFGNALTDDVVSAP